MYHIQQEIIHNDGCNIIFVMLSVYVDYTHYDQLVELQAV
jgi:hypothetical protein